MRFRRRRSIVAAVLLLGALLVTAAARQVWLRRDTSGLEIARLALEMNWREGESIAEVGAGGGAMAIFAAQVAGRTGRVYATEIDPLLVARLKQRAQEKGLVNLTVLQGGERGSNLPDGCCDAVFMRWVYHHLTHPAEMDASLFRAVRQNGFLAVVDFPPSLLHELKTRGQNLLRREKPPLVREGVPSETVVRQMRSAGFVLERRVAGWPGKGYCLLFRKNQ